MLGMIQLNKVKFKDISDKEKKLSNMTFNLSRYISLHLFVQDTQSCLSV